MEKLLLKNRKSNHFYCRSWTTALPTDPQPPLITFKEHLWSIYNWCSRSDFSPCHRTPWSVSMPCVAACCCGCCSCMCRSGSSEEDPSRPSERRSLYSDSWLWWRSAKNTQGRERSSYPLIWTMAFYVFRITAWIKYNLIKGMFLIFSWKVKPSKHAQQQNKFKKKWLKSLKSPNIF